MEQILFMDLFDELQSNIVLNCIKHGQNMNKYQLGYFQLCFYSLKMTM
jgi:hypothetical protein